jgi:hypothetical protein
VEADSAATVQEVHLVAVHLMCEAVDLALAAWDGAADGAAGCDGSDGSDGPDGPDGKKSSVGPVGRRGAPGLREAV